MLSKTGILINKSVLDKSLKNLTLSALRTLGPYFESLFIFGFVLVFASVALKLSNTYSPAFSSPSKITGKLTS